MEERQLNDLANRLRMVCMRISRRIRVESNDIIPPHQYSVLTELQSGPSTAGDIARSERVSAPQMTRNITALEGMGLVARSDDPTDGRRTLVELTGPGRTTMEAIRADRDAWMASRLRELSEEKLGVLLAAAAILREVEDMDAHGAPAEHPAEED